VNIVKDGILPLCLLGAATFAQGAAVLLNDNFNNENGGNGAGVYSGFANFVAADIDLLAPGFFFNLCQSAGDNTPCLDMEGNGNGSLTTRTAYTLPTGTVGLRFDLAGSQRGGLDKNVTVSLITTLGASLYSEVFTLPSSAPFSTVSRNISLGSTETAFLRFQSSGVADSFGLLLDNVALIADVAPNAVPEPSSYGLVAASLAALTWVRRRRSGRSINGKQKASVN